MSFDPGAQLDPSQVSDRRGMGRGGLAIGGGGIGLVLLLAYALLGGNPNDLAPLLEPGAVTGGPESSALATDCHTGQDANSREDCRILGYVNSIQAYWTDEFAQLEHAIRTEQDRPVHWRHVERCGTASAASGPFYCPLDKLVYLDLGFFDELKSRFGASGGSFAQGYVVAHEYGHHVQDLLGILGSKIGRARARPAAPSGPSSRPTASPASGPTTPRRGSSRRSRSRGRRRAGRRRRRRR